MPFLWGEPSCAVLPGSLPGTLLGKVLPKTRKEQLPTMFWLCSIGVNSVIKASGMTAVVLALLVGLYFLISGLQHKSATIHCQKIAQTPPPKQDFVGRGRSFYSFGNTAQFPPCGLSTAPAAAALRIMRYCPLFFNPLILSRTGGSHPAFSRRGRPAIPQSRQ